MAEPTPHKQPPICPHCGGHVTYRSKRRGPKDWVLHSLLFQSPYRCESCDRRFFHHRLAHHHKKELSHHPA